MINKTDKGKRFEREVCSTAREYGLEARRTPRSGATEFVKGDVQVKCGRHWLTGECKRRKELPKWIVEALGDHDFMAMRGDGGEALAVVDLDYFLSVLDVLNKHYLEKS